MVCSSDVIDDDALRFDLGMVLQGIDDEPRALELVFEMRGMDEDELVVIRGELDVLFKNRQLVAAVLVQADLADAENVGFVNEFRDQRDGRHRRA